MVTESSIRRFIPMPKILMHWNTGELKKFFQKYYLQGQCVIFAKLEKIPANLQEQLNMNFGKLAISKAFDIQRSIQSLVMQLREKNTGYKMILMVCRAPYASQGIFPTAITQTL